MSSRSATGFIDKRVDILMMIEQQVWTILLDWSISRGNNSFIKKVNRQSLEKVSRDFLTFSFSDVERLIKFLKYFSAISITYSKIRGIEICRVNNYNQASELEKNKWIDRILSLPKLSILRISDCDWVYEGLFQKVNAPLCLTELELRNLPLTGKTIENLLGFTPFLIDLKLIRIRSVRLL
jgi:hypothetical protein